MLRTLHKESVCKSCYYHLFAEAEDSGIGRNTKSVAIQNRTYEIAIVETGVAGLITAQDLFRSGYARIDICEASDRIGGCTYSIPTPNQDTSLMDLVEL